MWATSDLRTSALVKVSDPCIRLAPQVNCNWTAKPQLGFKRADTPSVPK